LVAWLVGDEVLLLKDFGLYMIILMNVCVVIAVAMVWRSFAVKGFWALWDNIITVAIVMLLREAYYVHSRKQKLTAPCICQWPVRRYSCYHNFAVYTFIMILLTVRLPTHLEQT
jgi:hypothetical protein